MYKPPQNSNRVKSIKSKFENINNKNEQYSCKTKPASNNLVNSSLTESKKLKEIPYTNLQNIAGSSRPVHQSLSRQLSDPSKRNIKRTPAFRVDKNLENGFTVKKNDCTTNKLFETKIKQFNSAKSSEKADKSIDKHISIETNGNLDICNNLGLSKKDFLNCTNSSLDNNLNITKQDYKTEKSNIRSITPASKRPSLIKSKSSHDFHYIRSKFDSRVSSSENYIKNSEVLKKSHITNTKTNGKENSYKNINGKEEALLNDVDLSLLYTEPIPKALRHQNSNISTSDTKSHLHSIDNIYSKSTLQLTDSNKKEFIDSLKQILQDSHGDLTDTLKLALSKPLPGGPAPKKPPRIFKHPIEVITNSLQKNSSFLHLAQDTDRTKEGKSGKKGDAKYMLNKLETALKNNKLRSKNRQKIDVSTTSGEDSDDSLLFQSKSRELPKLPGTHQMSLNSSDNDTQQNSLLGEFNCFNSFACGNGAYERVSQPSSSFFVDMVNEPIYAEPLQSKINSETNGNHRNSLYYMSTPLINGNNQNEESTRTSCTTLKIASDNSSLSSFASDVETTPSPTVDDHHAKIRWLIENFETDRRRTLPARLKRTDDSPGFSGTNKIEKLKNSLKLSSVHVLNNVTMNPNPRNLPKEGSRHDSKIADIITKFQTYQRTMPKYQKPNVNKNTLFYCCLIIEKVQDCAQIKFKYPPQVEVPREIEYLCFPENPNSPPLEGSSAAQAYTLLITSDTGERTYGYCRRVLPEGSSHCLPLAYCILSKYRAPRFYQKILLELESRHGMQNKHRDNLISQFYHKKFPKPGQSIVINLSSIEPRDTECHNRFEDGLDLTSYIHVNKTGEYGCLNSAKKTDIFISKNDWQASNENPSFVSYEGSKTELVLTLHIDMRYEDADLKRLHNLPSDILLKIFSSLLLERKVILISSTISDLSSCVDSLQSILYPFTWYHTFIPILPESLWDIVESPTPVVCGVLSPEAVLNRKIENGIVVNLDTKAVLSEEGDETKILSGSMQKVWRQFMTLANNIRTQEYVYSSYLANAYLYVFIYCLKNYKECVVDGQFLKDQFMANGKTKGVRRFLKMFTETCMFHAFMDTALNNPESLTDFDKKMELYGSDDSHVVIDKLIGWKK
ncbi:uncharacterized protein LOC115881873 [Sitophilus oryzae]|uniref:Uncharacterized protein LOC115881873 n=1 Tax=Sitophilus oryzae TaxID=7048 RepID=A0A6J2XV74_SITOR|nr:uncharacterized protein LOC115881873 [Sitophilus oryzae]